MSYPLILLILAIITAFVVYFATKKSAKKQDDIAKTTERIDIKTDEEFKTTGEFKIPLIPDEDFTFICGNKVTSMQKGDLAKHGGNYTFYPPSPEFSVVVQHAQILISARVTDLNRNLLLTIENNVWRVNKQDVSKFNYDDHGLEVFDRSGKLFFSIDIKPNLIDFAGILPKLYSNHLTILIKHILVTDGYYGTDDANLIIQKRYAEFPPRQLFKYTGDKWHGQRK